MINELKYLEKIDLLISSRIRNGKSTIKKFFLNFDSCILEDVQEKLKNDILGNIYLEKLNFVKKSVNLNSFINYENSNF